MEKLKVVIVDDEERICQLIQALINWEEMGLQVEGMAHNGIDACEVVRKVRPDILITDIRMPGCSGLELIEKVKKTCPELEIIVISGYAHFEYAQQAIKFGVGHYLLKPINRAELTETLEKLKQRIRERRESERDKEVLIQKAQKNESHMRSEFVLALFDGNVEKDMGNVLPEILEETYHIYLKPGILQAFCLKMDCEERALGNSSVDVLMEKAKEILERNLKDKCLEMAMELRDFYCFGFVNYESRYQEEIRRVLKNSLSQIEVQKAIFGQVDFSMALGSPGREIEDLYHSARETQKLICQRLVKGSGRLLEHMGEESSMQGEKCWTGISGRSHRQQRRSVRNRHSRQWNICWRKSARSEIQEDVKFRNWCPVPQIFLGHVYRFRKEVQNWRSSGSSANSAPAQRNCLSVWTDFRESRSRRFCKAEKMNGCVRYARQKNISRVITENR